MNAEIPDSEPRRIRSEPAPRRRVGRPRKKLDVALVEKLARAQLTTQEIAVICGVSPDTVERRFGATGKLQTWKAAGVGSVRRALFTTALSKGKGAVAAMIFFCKNYAGMRDAVALSAPDGGPVRFQEMSDGELDEYIRQQLVTSGIAAQIDSTEETGRGTEGTRTQNTTE